MTQVGLDLVNHLSLLRLTQVVFVFPTLMFNKLVKEEGAQASIIQRSEVIFVNLLMYTSISIAICALWAAIIVGREVEDDVLRFETS